MLQISAFLKLPGLLPGGAAGSGNFEGLVTHAQSHHSYQSACLQVVLLDPVQYPGAMKAFAREICRNDLLNFGRLHFFFPDSRMSLDLNTDKTLKVALLSGFWRNCHSSGS